MSCLAGNSQQKGKCVKPTDVEMYNLENVRILRIFYQMKSIFVESTIFARHRADYLTDESYRLLQAELMANPWQGDVIQGQAGYAKCALRERAKADGAVCGLSTITWMNTVGSTC